MKSNLYVRAAACILSIVCAQIGFAQTSTNYFSNLKKSGYKTDPWFTKAANFIDRELYAVKADKDHFLFANARQHAAFEITNHTVKTAAASGTDIQSFALTLTNIRRESGEYLKAEDFIPRASGNRLEMISTDYSMEFINSAVGLRQNFIINKKPDGEGNLIISLQAGGARLSAADNSSLSFTDASGKVVMKYDDLVVWDANRKLLKARMTADGLTAKIIVNDKNASYPVTVDPLSHMPEWTSSADGILPGILTNLQLQVDALYGYNVCGLGDVNGDGYDDVAIGAPGAVDVIAGPSTIVGAGAVFVYFGSATGLPVTPSKVLRATTPITNALFGFSIDGGNVNGDFKSDIIIGAPGESYSTSTGGTTTSANVTAGKVYIFTGEDLAAAGNPSPLLSIKLDGSRFFTTGIFGAGANVNVNALFGFSVAATDDVNGDGLGEIIVGSPGYAEAGAVPVRSGTALLYYSTNTASNTPVKLAAPSAGLLGLVNNEGLLFGFSVDGAGDYNEDLHADVIVGAPGGISLGAGNLLSGSAYVFTGNAAGTGIDSVSSVSLRSSPGIVGSVANLFGYSVKGLTNSAGARTGSVIIGAPNESVLSNLAGALRLRTGRIHSFTHTPAPPSIQTPTQTISSPRGNRLLSILNGQNLDVAALFGASTDNMQDVNCDGINDIIVGEPLSTSVGIINTNTVGGAVDIFLGNNAGTFDPVPFFTAENEVSFSAGVNAGSLLGYSVAGAGHTMGAAESVRALIGAPGGALDFSSGVFNLNNTFGTLFNFTSGNNGLGKAYTYDFNACGRRNIYNPDVNVTFINVPVPGNIKTNDLVPNGSNYGTPVLVSGPVGGVINLNTNGTYSFSAPNVGVYIYRVPVCSPPQTAPCPDEELKITVLTPGNTVNPPVANTDIAFTKQNIPVTIQSLMNDRAGTPALSLNPASVTILSTGKKGTAMVNAGTGDIIFTPAQDAIGLDSVLYRVCDNATTPMCATAVQYIYIEATPSTNETSAADDHVIIPSASTATGNVSLNDTDPEGNIQSVTPQSTTISGKGTFTLNASGAYTFIPLGGFSGPVSFPYSTCDNGTPQACASATLYILVNTPTVVAVDLMTFSASKANGAVLLEWERTADNDRYFELQRSAAGISWVDLGRVQAVGGAGAGTYQFSDYQPMHGKNYYRVKIVNTVGEIKYSNILAVTFDEKGMFVNAVYPNPFIDVIKFELVSDRIDNAVITITDITGKKLKEEILKAVKGTNYFSFAGLQNLSAGIYFLTVKTSDGLTTVKLKK